MLEFIIKVPFYLHIQIASCEYSTTICIDSTDLWDFHIEDRDGKNNTIKLNLVTCAYMMDVICALERTI